MHDKISISPCVRHNGMTHWHITPPQKLFYIDNIDLVIPKWTGYCENSQRHEIRRASICEGGQVNWRSPAFLLFLCGISCYDSNAYTEYRECCSSLLCHIRKPKQWKDVYVYNSHHNNKSNISPSPSLSLLTFEENNGTRFYSTTVSFNQTMKILSPASTLTWQKT